MHTGNPFIQPFIPVSVRPCPLSEKTPIPKNTPYTVRCLRIIVMARLIWGCYPYPTPKLTAAKSIQHWYISNSDLFLMKQKTPEAIKKAVHDVRRNARSSIDCIDSSITDKEILAIFAICEVYEAIDNIRRGESGDAIKERILTASTFFNLAKAGLEPATQDTAKNQAIPKDIKEIHYDDSAGILFVDKIHADLTTTEKVFFEYFWDSKSEIVHVDDVIEHMTTFNEFSGTSWDRGYFDTVLSNINSKGKRSMGTKLIKNVSKGSGEYSLSVKIKKKTFKP